MAENMFEGIKFAYILAISTPLIGAALVPYIGGNGSKARAWFAVLCGFITAGFTLLLVPNIAERTESFQWIPGLVTYTFRLDGLSVLMAVIVGCIGSLIVLYSTKYMEGQEGLARYYALTLMFIGAMLGLVLTDNLLILYFFWEIVGLCSYALIGFYYKDPKAARAGMKAFITTRVGDVFLLIGVLTLYWATNSFSIQYIIEHASMIPAGKLTLAAFCFLLGAIGKSAQVPLHVWLPDAMEAPTTISALIHAATMVNAGIYLIARMYPLFSGVDMWLDAIMWVGVITAILAASMALVEKDLKRVLAYSTVSQLGFMMFALGVGGYFAGVFHLMSHAIFKALLFLGAGAVIHEVGTRNMHEINGSAKTMTITKYTFLIGILALTGIPIFNGFWSKDMIIESALEHASHSGYTGYMAYVMGYLPLALAVTAAMFTVVYSFKMFWLVFVGKHESGHGQGYTHEAPYAMTIPLMLLAVGAAASWLAVGLVNWNIVTYGPHLVGSEVERLTLSADHSLISKMAEAPLAIGMSLGAICAGFVGYLYWNPIGRGFKRHLGPIYGFVAAGFYFDALYMWIVRRLLNVARAMFDWFEATFDWFNEGIATCTNGFASDSRRVQTGNLNINLFGIVLCVLLVMAMLYLGGKL